MSIVRFLLTRGNGKLGEAIHAFSLPAVSTCPGRSALCERHCYARHGRFRTDMVRDRLQANLAAAPEAAATRRRNGPAYGNGPGRGTVPRSGPLHFPRRGAAPRQCRW